MPLVNAKCTNCGANLEVDNTKDAAICPYCGSAYIVEKAINNYNITNNTTNNINAEVVNVYGGDSADFVIRGGVLEKYNGASTEVIIPNSVSIVGERAFENCRGITNVSIPDSVTTIEDYAFMNCNGLANVSIPDSVTTIGAGAFEKSGISHIVIPGTVQSIGSSAFCDCVNLEEVTIQKGVESVGDHAFARCINLSAVKIPDGVKRISTFAWSNTGLTKIIIPASVEVIEGGAFSGCSLLEEVTILGYPKLDIEIRGDDSFYPFDKCDKLATINASDEWKKTNINNIKILQKYDRMSRGVSLCCGRPFKTKIGLGYVYHVCSYCYKPKNY